MKHAQKYTTNQAYQGDLTEQEARIIEKMVGSFLSRLPGSRIGGADDVSVTLGTIQPGVIGDNLKPGQVSLNIDFPDQTGLTDRQAYFHAMLGAFISRRHLHTEAAPTPSGNQNASLQLTFNEPADVRDFFNTLSRTPLLQHTGLAQTR